MVLVGLLVFVAEYYVYRMLDTTGVLASNMAYANMGFYVGCLLRCLVWWYTSWVVYIFRTYVIIQRTVPRIGGWYGIYGVKEIGM